MNPIHAQTRKQFTDQKKSYCAKARGTNLQTTEVDAKQEFQELTFDRHSS